MTVYLTLPRKEGLSMAKRTHLARKMSARHVQMIALGGVIGTGLFLSSGYTIHQAGPLGTVIAYLVGALIRLLCNALPG